MKFRFRNLVIMLAGLVVELASGQEMKPVLPYKAYVHGGYRVCGLDQYDLAWCWGRRGPATAKRLSGEGVQNAPRPVSGGHRFRQLVGLSSSMVALDFEGNVWRWRSTSSSGSGEQPDVPERISEGRVFEALFGRYATACALTLDGEAWCIGQGPLGNGSDLPSDRFVRVSGARAFVQVSPGEQTGCALDRQKRVWCWGLIGKKSGDPYANDYNWSSVPVLMDESLRLESISNGYSNACGLDWEGQTWCWGPAWSKAGARFSPGKIDVGHALRSLDISPLGACGIDDEGQAWCFIGSGRTDRVKVDRRVVKLSLNQSTGLYAIDEDGRIWGLIGSLYSTVSSGVADMASAPIVIDFLYR